MSRAPRLLDLIDALRLRRVPVSAATLASELSVSPRTLYRDIATLRAQGVDIAGEPGVGYVLRPGFLLPPLMFSEDELAALVLGAAWVADRSDDRLASAARQAIARIRAVLPRDLLDALDEPGVIIAPGGGRGDGEESLERLRHAIRAERKLRIAYRDNSGALTERVVWPVALAFFEKVRILAAWCELRNGFRHFRADRIQSLEDLPDRLPRPRRALMRDWKRSILPQGEDAAGSQERATTTSGLDARRRRD